NKALKKDIAIGIHYCTQQLKDLIAKNYKMPYPHTGHIIQEYLEQKINKFRLQNKVTCIISDNGSNMKKAIELYLDLQRILCAAHTMQLSVNQGLCQIKSYTKKIKKLVKFFNSSKQSERLDQAQQELYQQSFDDKNSEFEDFSDFSSEDSVSENERRSISQDSSLFSLNYILERVRKAIYDSLFEYWENLLQIRLLATLLDLCVKHLQIFDNNIQNDAISELQFQFKTLMQNSKKNTNINISKSTSTNILFRDIFESNYTTNDDDELS
ncbi:9187_t:CDS:2, partial [Racocetra persica]